MNETLFVFEGRPFTMLEVAAGGGGFLLFLLLLLMVMVIAGQRRRARARRDLEEQLRFMAQAHGELTGRVLEAATGNGKTDGLIEAWADSRRPLVARTDQLVTELQADLVESQKWHRSIVGAHCSGRQCPFTQGYPARTP